MGVTDRSPLLRAGRRAGSWVLCKRRTMCVERSMVALPALLLLLSLGTRTAASSQLLHVAPYGANAVRVRMFAQQPTVAALSNPGYLLPPPAADDLATARASVLAPPADQDGAWLRSGVAVASGNIEVVLSGAGGFTVRRISDGATLLTARSGALAAGTPSADGRAQLNATLGVATGTGLRFYGGGCRCGGGYNQHDGHDGGDMTNPGRNASADLSFGVPIGLAPSPQIPGMTGGLGSQCGMMNGMPWVVAASISSGVEFGLFVNTQGWTYGTASASRQTVELCATRAHAVDVVVTTWPAGASATGSSRASAIQGWYADALGHVPVMSREVVGYWHSKDSIGSQSEAESIVMGVLRSVGFTWMCWCWTTDTRLAMDALRSMTTFLTRKGWWQTSKRMGRTSWPM